MTKGSTAPDSTPWWPSIGAVFLAVAAAYTLTLDGTSYPWPGRPCLVEIHYSVVVKALLLGLAAIAVGFAVIIRFVPWGRRLVYLASSVGVVAVSCGLYWLIAPYGRGAGLLSILAAVYLFLGTYLELYRT